MSKSGKNIHSTKRGVAMGIFLFFILILLVFLLFAPIKLKIDSLKGKKGIFDLKIYFCSFLVYSAIYYIHLRNDIRLHFIQIKKNSFRYIPVKLKANSSAWYGGCRIYSNMLRFNRSHNEKYCTNLANSACLFSG